MSVETIAISIGFSMLAAIFVSSLFKGGKAVQQQILQPRCEICDGISEELMENPYEKFYTCHKCDHIWSIQK